MGMKYIDARIAGLGTRTPKEMFREDYQENVNESFYESSDWYTIQEETVFGSEDLVNLDVRIISVISATTGVSQGDDYKKLLFKDLDHTVHIGYFYVFDSNYWVVTNTEKDKTLTPTATVKRCNNTLRWQTSDGALYSVPCSIDYGIRENRDYSTAGSAVVNPSGLITVTTQMNDKTNQIDSSQRFLFGNSSNWTGYKVVGGGIENHNNLQTSDNDSSGVLKLTMSVDSVATTDDLTNGVADMLHEVFTLSLSESSVDGNVAGSLDLYATVELNGSVVNETVDWSSSDVAVATVDSSGNVSFIALGSCIITASLDENSSVNDTCGVDVLSAPVSEYQVVVTPDSNKILENMDETYNVKLVLNGVDQADVFAFSVTSLDVPTDNYTFTAIDGNNFKVENLEKYLDEPLVVNCLSGIHSKNVSINLRGAW